MIPIERQLPALGASLIALAAWLLALTTGSWFQALVATALAVASVVFNDYRRKVTLNNLYANILAVIVFVIAVARIPAFTGDEILLAMTDALVFLQILLMFKHKRAYDYWLLMLANMLEVAVASALSLNYLFSIGMVIYLLIGIYTLGLLLLLSEHEKYHSPRPKHTPGQAASPARWPMLGAAVSFARVGPVADLNAGLGVDFRRRMVRIALWTLFLTIGLFVVMPRVGQTTLRRFGPTQMVGFAEQISLNEFGKVAENTDRVMRVLLSDVATGAPVTLQNAPLWQGGTLVTYSEGEWSRSSRRPSTIRLPVESDVDGYSQVVRQQITVEPSNTTVVWCLFPPIRDDYAAGLSYSTRSEQLHRIRSNQKMNFELFTLGIRDRLQLPLTPHRGKFTDVEREELLQLPPPVDGVDSLAALRTLATQIVTDSPPGDTLRRARLLEAYLSDATRFKYTLTLPKRAANVDPIVDFLTTQREGHCEYFASALALMLRAVGIPARIVVGFKGGEIDAITSAYDVKTADAHSWVEAYIDEGQLSNELRSSPLWKSILDEQDKPDAEGAWLRLDPTPFTPGLDPSQRNIVYYLFRETMMYARAAWSNYVIGLDAVRQRELIYDPLVRAYHAAFQLETYRDLAAWIASFTRELFAEMAAGNPYAWFKALFLLSVLTLGGMLVRHSLLWVIARWHQRREAGRIERRQVVEVPVYRQMETILARAGHKRSQQQTPREFAFLVGGELSDSTDTLAVAGVPRKVVDVFYRVRFGGEKLEREEAAALEQSLGQLREALRKRKATKRRPVGDA
ncbi:MAG: DUF3488 domain-containing protein [Planctomycetaceae bacterium]|nr:DUF3488 domain-containing protein [Planctomycetaceae bacterium]